MKNPAPAEVETVPTDLRKVLSADPKAKARWVDLTPLARRDFILWIDQAKQLKTRKQRIESVPSRLASGKRRPCCFSIVPTNLFKAFTVDPKAKTQWSDLTSIERREFSGWIESAKTPEERKHRAAKARELLAKGKRHP